MGRVVRAPHLVAMVQLPEELASWPGIVDQLDLLALALVALTARALHDTAANLSLLQWRALVELQGNGPLRLHALALLLPSSMPAASRLIKRLLERGLLTTEPVPSDGRGVSLRLSPAGRDVYAAVVDRRQRLIADAIGPRPIPPDLEHGLAVLGQRLRMPSLVAVGD